jgi:hypothetical protein
MFQKAKGGSCRGQFQNIPCWDLWPDIHGGRNNGVETWLGSLRLSAQRRVCTRRQGNQRRLAESELPIDCELPQKQLRGAYCTPLPKSTAGHLVPER